MKTLLTVIALLAASQAYAYDTYVGGHYRSNGTYVQPYQRTAPDNSMLNNYSTRGNVNIYTGNRGTVNPYSQPSGYKPVDIRTYKPYDPFDRD